MRDFAPLVCLAVAACGTAPTTDTTDTVPSTSPSTTAGSNETTSTNGSSPTGSDTASSTDTGTPSGEVTHLTGPWVVVMACDVANHRILLDNGSQLLGIAVSGNVPWSPGEDLVMPLKGDVTERHALVWELSPPASGMDMCGTVEELPGYDTGDPFWVADGDGELRLRFDPDYDVVPADGTFDGPYDFTTPLGTLHLELDALELQPMAPATTPHTLDALEATAEVVMYDLPA
jgi:hypothetical protein